ncbi:MAG: adenosylcobinamide-GDP ribazoletransferase, partial [Pseudomonadota bacterium]
MTIQQHHAERGAAMPYDLKVAMIFLTRIPVKLEGELSLADLARAAHLFPIVGIILGAIAGTVLMLAQAVSLPPVLGVMLAITAMILLTGALHEDGFADISTVPAIAPRIMPTMG